MSRIINLLVKTEDNNQRIDSFIHNKEKNHYPGIKSESLLSCLRVPDNLCIKQTLILGVLK